MEIDKIYTPFYYALVTGESRFHAFRNHPNITYARTLIGHNVRRVANTPDRIQARLMRAFPPNYSRPNSVVRTKMNALNVAITSPLVATSALGINHEIAKRNVDRSAVIVYSLFVAPTIGALYKWKKDTDKDQDFDNIVEYACENYEYFINKFEKDVLAFGEARKIEGFVKILINHKWEDELINEEFLSSALLGLDFLSDKDLEYVESYISNQIELNESDFIREKLLRVIDEVNAAIIFKSQLSLSL